MKKRLLCVIASVLIVGTLVGTTVIHAHPGAGAGKDTLLNLTKANKKIVAVQTNLSAQAVMAGIRILPVSETQSPQLVAVLFPLKKNKNLTSIPSPFRMGYDCDGCSDDSCD